MDAATLSAVMANLDIGRTNQLLPGANEALALIGATDASKVKRAAQFLAQIGHESVSLRFTEEIADGSAYNGRADLGNTQPGDGPRFKGRSFIQITGRHNYGLFSQWANSQKLVPSPSHFVDHPAELANDRWAWIGAVWYWLEARPGLNTAADAEDIETCTRMINGGLNGFEDRRNRYAHCMQFGTRILGTTIAKDWFDMATKEELKEAMREVLNEGAAQGTTGWAQTSQGIMANTQKLFNQLNAIKATVEAVKAKLGA
jgi:putative chitinase